MDLEQIRKMVRAEIDTQIHLAIKEEESKRFRQLRWIIVAIGILGSVGVSLSAKYTIESYVDAKTSEVTNQADLYRLNLISQKSENAGLGEVEAESATILLKRMHDADQRVEPDQLVSIIRGLTSGDRRVHINRVVAMYEEQLFGLSEATEVLLMHYGDLINSFSADTAESVFEDELRTFEKLEGVATPLK